MWKPTFGDARTTKKVVVPGQRSCNLPGESIQDRIPARLHHIQHHILGGVHAATPIDRSTQGHLDRILVAAAKMPYCTKMTKNKIPKMRDADPMCHPNVL